MKQLWAPWRMEYILDESRHNQAVDSCVFCLDESAGTDHERLVLLRGERAFVVMNRFPYNNGHLLVVPYRHVADLCELSDPENSEISQLICRCRSVLQQTMNPQGMNIGLNLGAAAGAGIADHLHWHLVPRWQGDTNFMPVLGDTRVIPQHLEESYQVLLEAFTTGREE
ncbi:MAG: HIT family hydrolase [Desulfuromonas sp.]|nr:MAG: HIT family hydrolase [Desulfuromonas sp.]